MIALCHLSPSPKPDPEPLPKVRRLALEWDGSRYAEIDPATGECLAVGCVEAPVREQPQQPREEVPA